MFVAHINFHLLLLISLILIYCRLILLFPYPLAYGKQVYHLKSVSGTVVDRVHEDSSVLEGFQDFPVLLVSQVAKVLWGLRATQGLLVSQDLMGKRAQEDQ